MSIGRQEEIIMALWAICSILCFGFGFTVLGWGFAIKAFTDFLCIIILVTVRILKEGKV